MTAKTANTSNPWSVGLRVSNFCAGYAGHEVVHDISLALPRGRISVLVGPGGSGKTTFLKALLGDHPPEIWRRASRVELPGPSCRVQWQMPAEPGMRLGDLLAPTETLSEQLLKQARRVIASVWPSGSRIGQRLESQLESRVEDLAPWYPRLAAFTATLAKPASFYVFDEPDADLPEETIARIAERIPRLVPDASVLLVTHNLKLARKVGDYVVLMIDGKIIEADEVGDFFTHPAHSRTRDFVRLGC